MGCTPKFCLIFVVVACTSCNSPEAVAAFAASAGQAIDQGPPLFRDLYGSCARARLDRQPVEPLFKGKSALEPDTPPPVAACTTLQSEGNALATDSAAFSAYFKTMHELAAFDTSGVNAPSSNAITQAATTANLSVSQVYALGKLAGLVTQAATDNYQRSHLIQYLGEANESVTHAAQAFEKVARETTKDCSMKKGARCECVIRTQAQRSRRPIQSSFCC